MPTPQPALEHRGSPVPGPSPCGWPEQRSVPALSHHSRQLPPTPPYDMYGAGGHTMSHSTLVDESAAPESRLKIYSDLFEEVIERDRVFGSLLRKIKTAYDMLLVKGGEHDVTHMQQHMTGHQSAMAPPRPAPMDSWVPDMSQSSIAGRAYGGPHSNEPTTRAEDGIQAWEMHRENRVLKDLVERLHLELEEAVKREHRWKQKVAKLKTRAEHAGDAPRPPVPAPQAAPCYPSPEDSWAAGYQKGMQAVQMQAMQAPLEDPAAGAQKLGPGAHSRSFHASRREPDAPPGQQEAEQHEGALNQGGLLSLSSISPQNSGNPAPETMDCMLGACESARSADSGMLPQRPTRRLVMKPSHVPSLDLTRLQQQLEEEELEEEGQGELGEEDALHEEATYMGGMALPPHAVHGQPGHFHADPRETGSEESYAYKEGEDERQYAACGHLQELYWEPADEHHQ